MMTYRQREKRIRRLCAPREPVCFGLAGVALVPTVVQLAMAAHFGLDNLPRWADDWRIMAGSIATGAVLAVIGALRGEVE